MYMYEFILANQLKENNFINGSNNSSQWKLFSHAHNK